METKRKKKKEFLHDFITTIGFSVSLQTLTFIVIVILALCYKDFVLKLSLLQTLMFFIGSALFSSLLFSSIIMVIEYWRVNDTDYNEKNKKQMD